ncbi:GNAT family N-acetyltransferase [Oceanobacillus sp. FSL K6-2867]|uniref:GNAT family N-acetyltransferase n=1 Tax=Oceanobacillus sp. FSL K6-2867 TaxID=2954748 RepID=UPI0030D71F2F
MFPNYIMTYGKNDNDFLMRFKKHATYKDFQGFIAYEEENIVGFVYGYVSLEGQYYNGLLREQLMKEEAVYWPKDCFEIVELAVHPSDMGKKLAQKLMSHLFDKVSTKTAVFTTRSDKKSSPDIV